QTAPPAQQGIRKMQQESSKMNSTTSMNASQKTNCHPERSEGPMQPAQRRSQQGTPMKPATKLLTLLLTLTLLRPLLPAQANYTFRTPTEVVLVNATVRDKTGNFVRDLKPEDFTILEDNKPQKILSFDIENTDAIANQEIQQVKTLNLPAQNQPATPTSPSTP